VQSVEVINGLNCGLRQALQWHGQQWILTLSSPRMASPELSRDLLFAVQAGEIRGYFAMSHRAAEELVAVRSGMIRWREMDEDLAMALLQYSLDELAGRYQTNEVNALTIDRVDNHQDALSMPLQFDIALRPENGTTSIEILFLCEVESALRLVPLAEKRPFLLYLPFLVIDLIVSNILLSLGMMMVSPTTISLPLKLFLFVMIDGWTRLMHGLVLSYA